MENSKIDAIVEHIKALEYELEVEVHKEYEKFNCEIAKKKKSFWQYTKMIKEGYLNISQLLHCCLC